MHFLKMSILHKKKCPSLLVSLNHYALHITRGSVSKHQMLLRKPSCLFQLSRPMYTSQNVAYTNRKGYQLLPWFVAVKVI